MLFFSSRRRHTRCLSDWSSDVCSSDLDAAEQGRMRVGLEIGINEVRNLPRMPMQLDQVRPLDLAQIRPGAALVDRKSTRLNSSHLGISYAGFCLENKIQQQQKSRIIQ